MVWASVCLSVCLSVTLLYCVKTVQARITISLLWAVPRTPVYRDKISCPWVRGFPRTRASNTGPPKRRYLPLLALIVWKRLQIGTDLLHILTSTGDRLFRFVNIDDLERSWTPQKGFWVNVRNFWLQRTFQQWIATKWLEIDQDNLRMKFFALNVDISSLNAKVQGGLHTRASKSTLPQSGYFTAIGSCSAKMVANRYRHAAYYNKLWRRVF